VPTPRSTDPDQRKLEREISRTMWGGIAFRILIFAIAALAFFGVKSAIAAPFTPRMQFAFELANEHWGGPPPNCTTIDAQIVDPSDFEPGQAGEATIPAEGWSGPCILYLASWLAPSNVFESMCAVMFHEDGHLHGFEHSPNPKSIMYPSVRFVPRACQRADLWLMNHPRRLR
jgi:matrixin